MKLLALFSAYFLAVECSDLLPRIISTNYAQSMDRFPYIVSLKWCNPKACISCGGSIISDQVVLTAAHCVFDKDTNATVNANVTKISVNAGSLYGVNSRGLQHRIVANLIANYNYTRLAPNNTGLANNYDIALLKLRQPFNVTGKLVKIIPLASSAYVPHGNAIVSGWGSEDVYARQDTESKILKFAQVKILNQTECAQFPEIIEGNMVCTYAFKQGFCGGDSGGPLVQTKYDHQNGRKYDVLVGVVSFIVHKKAVNNITRAFCGVAPNFYASVPHFRQYIDRNKAFLKRS